MWTRWRRNVCVLTCSAFLGITKLSAKSGGSAQMQHSRERRYGNSWGMNLPGGLVHGGEFYIGLAHRLLPILGDEILAAVAGGHLPQVISPLDVTSGGVLRPLVSIALTTAL